MKKLVIIAAAWSSIVPSVVSAGFVEVSGSGTWGPDAPASAYTAAGASWSFSFDVPDPLEADPTSMAADFRYSLDGSAVVTTLSSVEFFSSDRGGLFDLNLSDGNSLNLYGNQVEAGPGPSLIPGIYSANIDINSYAGYPDGIGSGTVTLVSVPGPPSIVGCGLGLLGLAGLAPPRVRRGILGSAREA